MPGTRTDRLRRATAVGLIAVLAWMVPRVSAQTAEVPRGSSVPDAQPAVTLPHRDILNPEAEIGLSPGQKLRPVPESGQEIRRSTDPPGASAGDASEAGEDSRVLQRKDGGAGDWRVRDFLPLMLVLAFIGLAAWAVKRYLPARRLVTGSGVLEIVARLPLSAKQSLVLVKMGRQLVLVGVSPERVNTVCLVDDPEHVADLIGRIASRARESSTFGQSLDHQEAFFDDGAEEEPPFQAAGGVRGLLEKVRQLSRSPLN